MQWYTAGTHFGHDNIIKHCKYPSKSSQDMGANTVANIQNFVEDADDLWIVGDFAFGKNSRENFTWRRYLTRFPVARILLSETTMDLKRLNCPGNLSKNLSKCRMGQKRRSIHSTTIRW